MRLAPCMSITSGTSSTTTASPVILLPREAAGRLSITVALLRKLTDQGAIGHVRLGAGELRVRIGYTERQIEDFIRARTVPPAPPADAVSPVSAASGSRRRPRRRNSPAPTDVSEVASTLVKAAIEAGRATEWRRP